MDHLFAGKPAERASIGVRSGTVMTVTGPVPVDEMGVTLMHEHILLDGAKAWRCPCDIDDEGRRVSEQPVNIEIIGELRMNPTSIGTTFRSTTPISPCANSNDTAGSAATR